jgi:alkylated DNA repair dioxygenase AlkB
MQTILRSNDSALYIGRFPDIGKYVDALLALPLHTKPPIMVYGRPCRQGRDVNFFSDESIGYGYSGQLMPSVALTPELSEILDTVNLLFSDKFNGILVNCYRSGSDSIGAHSDDERSLGTSGVVSLSIGTTRKFRIRDKSTKKIVLDCTPAHGYLVHMAGAFQREFTHEIPKELRIKEQRLSLTFRHHTK